MFLYIVTNESEKPIKWKLLSKLAQEEAENFDRATSM